MSRRTFGAALLGVLAIAFVPFASASIATGPLPAAIARARALVEEQIAPHVPGVSVAVGVDGEIVWSEGFGYADLGAKLPVTTTTRFRVGSISKSLTAAGLALLVERGELDLDAPVQKYVPDFPDKGAPITTRMLGGHLAGIRHYQGREMYLNRPFADPHAAFAIFANDPLVSPPGRQFHYSTYGWTVISAVMESAAHREFTAFMAENVFAPLHMIHTRADRAGAADPKRTEFYELNAAGVYVVAPPVDNSYKWAGGGFLSTPEDLVRFGSAHLQPGFLKAETLRLLFTPQVPPEGQPSNYGIGWTMGRDAAGHRVMFHTGGSVGGTSILLLHPESKTVVAMTCNLTNPSPFKKANWEAIAELFAPLFAAAK